MPYDARISSVGPRPVIKGLLTDDTLSKYFEKGEKILEYLKKLKEYLEKREAERKAREDTAAGREEMQRLAKAQGYWSLSAENILTKRPSVVIRNLKIMGVKSGGRTYDVIGKEISNAPELHDKPMVFTIFRNAGYRR